MPRSISKTPRGLSANKRLKAIINNRTSGASDIEESVYAWLDRVFSDSKTASSKNISTGISRLRSRFGCMANILNLLDFIEKIPSGTSKSGVLEFIREYENLIETDRRKTIDTTAKKIGRYKSIFTLSNSSVITNAVLEAKKRGWNGTVNIVESRPMNEGLIPARKFAKAGLKVILAVDSAIPRLIENSGAVFIGADAVTQTYFVNKIGSRIALDYAEKYNKPAFVAADRSKFISNRKYKFIPDVNPPDEILKFRSENLTVINSYFEQVRPRGRIKFICGKSTVAPEKVKNLLKQDI